MGDFSLVFTITKDTITHFPHHTCVKCPHHVWCRTELCGSENTTHWPVTENHRDIVHSQLLSTDILYCQMITSQNREQTCCRCDR